MAKILKNTCGRRLIKLSVDDVFMVISQYQQLCNSKQLDSEEARKLLRSNEFYLPEEI